MSRSSGAGGKAEKTRRPKTTKVARRAAPRAARPGPSAADLQEQLDLRNRELSGALEQQAAAAEVLCIIASSSGDLAPVFDAIVTNAVRLCKARFGNLWMRDGDGFRCVALCNAPPAWAEFIRREPILRPGPHTGLARVAKTR